LPDPLDILQVRQPEPIEEDYDKKNDEWFKANYLDLIQDHPFTWIAVCDQKVIATARTRAGAATKAKETVGEKRCSFYFIEPSDIRIGLS
jgi:nucleoside diphosphate kinase